MFLLMDKKIITILRKLFFLNWPYVNHNIASTVIVLKNFNTFYAPVIFNKGAYTRGVLKIMKFTL